MSSAPKLTALLCCILLALNACQRKQAPTPPPPPQVTVARPQVQEVTRYISFTGFTKATAQVELLARVEGFLEAIHYQPGGLVKKGDLLFTIDPKPFAARLRQAQAKLAALKTEEQLAQATYERTLKAYKTRAVSEIAMLQAKAAFAKAQSGVAGAEAETTNAQLDLSYTQIKAPVNGRMGRNLVDPGNLVGAGGQKTHLATLSKDNPIYAYFNVDEASFMRYKQNHPPAEGEGQGNVEVQLALEGQQDYPYSGLADYLDPSVDRETGTVQVRAIFNNPEHFITPGQFARVRLPLYTKPDTLLVPEMALGTDQRGRFLMVVDQDNKAQYRQVTVGQAMLDGRVVIEEGLTKEDLVIVKGVQRARPGMPVTPQQEGAAAEAKAQFSK